MNTKSKPVIVTSIEGSVVTVEVNAEPFAIDITTLAPELLNQAALHGLKQKLSDAAAISRDPETGRSATPADKADAVRVVWERITSGGSWNQERGSGTPQSSQLVRALMEHFKKDRATVLTFLGNKTKEEKAALRLHSPIAAIILRYQMEAVKASTIDTDAMLAGLK